MTRKLPTSAQRRQTLADRLLRYTEAMFEDKNDILHWRHEQVLSLIADMEEPNAAFFELTRKYLSGENDHQRDKEPEV